MVIPDEIKTMIGKETEPVVTEVEKGAMMKLAMAVDDPNPLWQDEKYARGTRYGGIVASPAFVNVFRGLVIRKLMGGLKLPPEFRGVGIDGGTAIEYYHPIKPEDIITSVAKVIDIKEKSGRLGTMLIFTLETTYTNHLGQVAAKSTDTTIMY
jgi:acyl dehydratase